MIFGREIERNGLVLLSGGKGNKIIVTTRSNIVVDVMATVPRYELKGCLVSFRKSCLLLSQAK